MDVGVVAGRSVRILLRRVWAGLLGGEPSMTAEVFQISSREYHSRDGRANASGLMAFAKNPALYYQTYIARTVDPEPPTLDMTVGSLTHSLVFEPELAEDEYVVYPQALPSKGRVFEDWRRAQAQGRVIVPASYWRLAEAMRDSILSLPRSREIVEAEGHTELSIYWTDEATGIPCKARVDKLFLRAVQDLLVDLKTTSMLTRFPQSIVRYGYLLQGAHYAAAVQAWTGRVPRFSFLVVEKAPEHLVAIRDVLPAELAAAERYRRQLLEHLAHCRATNVWPAQPITFRGVPPMPPDSASSYSYLDGLPA